MNVSKRTWILLGIVILSVLGCFASLYLEKEEEIKTLESIEPDKPVTRSRVKKGEPGQVVTGEIITPETIESDGNNKAE